VTGILQSELLYSFSEYMKDTDSTKKRLTGRNVRMRRQHTSSGTGEKECAQSSHMHGGEELQYRPLISNMLHGFAYHKILVDENNTPVDYVFLEVNDAFETYTGLSRDSVIGKKATEVIPGIKKAKPDLIGMYGNVALTGKGTKFELYFEPFKKWYYVSAFSPKKGYFICFFDEFTQRKNMEESLRASEEKFRMYYEKAPLGYQLLDGEGYLIDVNQAWLEIMGYNREEVIGRQFAEFLTPEYSEKFRKKFPSMKEAGEMVDTEFEMLRKDGSLVYVSCKGKFGYDEQGGIKQEHCMVSNITAIKKAEKEVLNIARGVSAVTGEKFFSSLVEHLAQILETDYAYIAEMVPDRPANARTMAFIAGDKFIDNVEVNLEGTPCEKVTQKGQCSYPSGVQKLFPDASVMAAMKVESYFGMQLSDSSGAKIGLMAVMSTKPVRDVARIESMLQIFASRAEAELERIHKDKALKESEEKYRLLFSNEQDAIILVDAETYMIIDANDSALRLYGYGREEMLKMAGPDISAEPEKTAEAIRETIEGTDSSVYYFKRNHRKKEGTVFPVEISAGTFLLGGRKVISAIMRDITQLRKTEQRLRVSERKLKKQKTALEHKNLALREIVEQINIEKDKIKRDVAMNVDKTLLPIISRLSLSEDSEKFGDLLKYHLNELVSSFGHNISKKSYNLTLKEIEICNMIRGSLTNKEICKLLKISHQTVEKHRKNIRKKLGLTNKKINLASYLQQI
jgi:PAS domain S-box-containing protein